LIIFKPFQNASENNFRAVGIPPISGS